MKHIFLSLAAALLALSAVSCKCSNSTSDNSDHSFYAQNMNDALCLEAEVFMEPPVNDTIPTSLERCNSYSPMKTFGFTRERLAM